MVGRGLCVALGHVRGLGVSLERCEELWLRDEGFPCGWMLT